MALSTWYGRDGGTALPGKKWVKVGSDIQTIKLWRSKTSVTYYAAFTAVGAAAPGLDGDRTEGIPIFQDQEPNYDAFGFDTAVDFWVYVDNDDPGVLRADVGVSLGGSVVPTAGNPAANKEVESEAPGVEHFFWEELNAATPLGAGIISRGTNEVTFEPGHGFLNPSGLDADYWNIHYVDTTIGGFVGIRFSQHIVTSVVGDVVQFTPPLPYDLDPAKIEKSTRVNINMAVAATRAAPVVFQSYPPDGQVWELRRFMPSMVLSSSGDDGLFGNLPRLTNGEYSGFENAQYAEYQVVIQDNGDWASSAYDTKYPIRSGGGGSHGFNVRKSIAGKDKSGIIAVLYGVTDDRFVNVKQDSTIGIVRYRIKVIGSIRP